MQQPTAPELEILKLLWQQQPQTARQLHDQLSDVLGWSYSSTRKTLERMTEKALIGCDNQGAQNSYMPKVDKVSTLAQFASDFASRIFEINNPLPVATFSGSKLFSAAELNELELQLAQLAANQLPHKER